MAKVDRSVTVQDNATCSVCSKPFFAQRSSAKYCGGVCRQMAKRDRDMLWQRVRDIERMLDEIERTSHPQKMSALHRINRAVQRQL